MNLPEKSYASVVQKGDLTQRDKIKNARIFAKANFEKNNGNYRRAEKLYHDCIKIDPNDDASFYELGNIYLSMERAEDARIAAEKACKIDPSNDYYSILLAAVYKMQTNFPASIKIIKALVQKNPGKYNYLRELAYLYVLSQDYDNALKTLDKIESKTGFNEIISNQKQQLYLNMKKPAKAIEELEKLTKKYPYESKYLQLLAEMSLQNGFDEKALQAYKKIVEINPEDPFVHISLFDFYRRKNQKDKALKELKIGFANPGLDVDAKFQVLLSFYSAEEIYGDKLNEALELVNILDKTHPNNIRTMGIKADLLYRDKQYKPAQGLVRKVIEKEENQYQWHELLIIIDSDSRDTLAMEQDSRKAIELFPDQALPYMVLGLSKIQQEKLKEAKQAFLSGVKLCDSNERMKAQFYSYLGDTYHELQEIEKSDLFYEKALKIDSLNSLVLNNYAYYLAVRGEKLKRAKVMSSKAVELDPENSSNIDTHAWVLYKMGDYDNAKIWIEKAFNASDRESAELYEHYGDILYKLGHKKKAIKNWKKAKSIGEGSEFLNRKIKDKILYE